MAQLYSRLLCARVASAAHSWALLIGVAIGFAPSVKKALARKFIAVQVVIAIDITHGVTAVLDNGMLSGAAW